MGNDSSKNKNGMAGSQYGGLYIHLDKSVYSPEETATGTINIQLHQPFPGYQLHMTLQGTEFARWVQRQRRTRRRKGKTSHYYVNVTRRAQLETINQNITIYTWDQNQGMIPPGQYSFPFAFMIPKGLPGSFYFQRGSAIGSIRYLIKGFLVPSDPRVPTVQHERDLTIRENLYQQIQTRETFVNKEIKSCCCISKGNLNIKTYFEKNAYAPGETARIISEIDNSSCSSAISSLKFELVQSINLQAQRFHKSLSSVISSTSLGKIEGGAPKEVKESSIKLPPGQEGKVMEYNDGDNQYQDESALVNSITPSVNGFLVKSNFALRLSTEVDACVCCDVMPQTSLPIQVYSVALLNQPVPVVPNWQPIQMPVSNLTVNMLSIPADYQLNQYDNNMINNTNMMDYNQMPRQSFQNYGENTYTSNQVVLQSQPMANNVEMVNYNQYVQ